MYSTKWLIIFVLLAILHGCRSFNTAVLGRLGVINRIRSTRCQASGRDFTRLYSRKVNDLESFPDADNISAREATKDDHLAQFTVYEESEPKKDIWKCWQERHVAEETLQLAIRSNLTEDAVLPFFDAYKAHLIHDKVAVLNANEHFFFACCLGDMVALRALWAPSPDVVSMTSLYHVAHLEGSNIIGGYQNILNYYAKTTPNLLDYELADINLKFYGDVAVVTCKVRYFNQPKSVTNRQPLQVHYVTNVFVKEQNGDRYQLQTHMSSPCVLNASLRIHSKVPEKNTYKDPFRKVKPRVPTMEEEVAHLLNSLKSGGKPSSRSDSDRSGAEFFSTSKAIVDDLTGADFELSAAGDIEDDHCDGKGSGNSINGGARLESIDVHPSTTPASSAIAGHVYTPADIENMSPKEIDQRLRLLSSHDEMLKVLGLRPPDDGKDSPVGGMEGPLSDLFGDALSSAAIPTNATDKTVKLADFVIPKEVMQALTKQSGAPVLPSNVKVIAIKKIDPSSTTSKSADKTAGGMDASLPSEIKELFDRIIHGDGGSKTADTLAEEVEKDSLMRQELASRTLALLQHLYTNNAISESTLTMLSKDIQESLDRDECSEVELAYTLFFLGGGDNAFEALKKKDPNIGSDGPSAYANVSAEDMNDFAAFCNRSVRLRSV